MSDRRLALTVLLKGIDTLSRPLMNVLTASNGAQGALRKLSDTEKAQKSELRSLREEMGKSGVATRDMIEREKRLETQIAATTRKIDQQKKAATAMAQAKAKADRATEAGMKNITTGATIAGGLFLAGKAAADFETGMIDIRQKADLSAAATSKLQANIIAAAKAAKQMPENMRMGVDFLAGAGLDPNQAVQMMTPIGRAATAYNAQIEDLSKASFAAVDNLKVPIADTGKLLDAMAKAGKMGNFEIADMAMYFPALTAGAQALGQKGVPAVADMAAALQIARKGAGDSATAANNLQNLLAKINTGETVKNFKKFGIDLPAAMKKAAKEGKTPMEAIAELTKMATKGDLSKISYLFSDMQVQQALRPLIQNIDEYRRIRAASLNAAGTIDADFAIRAQSAATQARALGGDLQNTALILGSKLLPYVAQFSGNMVVVADKMSGWMDKHPLLTNAIMATLVALSAANLALGGARLLYGGIIGPITAVSNAYNVLRTSAAVGAVVSGASSLMAGGWAAVTAASGPFVASMFSAAAATWAVAWPVLAVVAACALVAGAIAGVVWAFMNWDKVSAWFAGIWLKIKTVFTSINWGQLGGDMLNGLVAGIVGGIPGLLFAFGKVALAGVDHFKKILGIHSPSRLFMEMGGHISKGLGIGIEDGMDHPLKKAAKLAAGVAGAAAMGLSTPSMAATPSIGSSLPAPSASALPASGGSGLPLAAPGVRSASAQGAPAPVFHFAPGSIVINAAPGQSADDLVAAFEKLLQAHAERAQAAQRSAYVDDDA